MPQFDQWEYKLVEVSGWYFGEKSPMVDQLNALGRDGWEAVTIERPTLPSMLEALVCRVLLKRRRVD